MKKTCTECGKKVKGNFCINCGTKLNNSNAIQITENSETDILSVDVSNNKRKSILKLWWFWLIAVIVIIGFIVGIVVAVDSDSGHNSDYSYSVETSNAAISKVKNYFYTEERIASELGFKSYYSPSYGTCDADEKYDGSWEVELNGNMSGYTDDFNSDFDKKNFKLTATVSSSGSVSINKVYDYSY